VGTGAISYGLFIVTLSACHTAREVQPESVAPVRYRGPVVPAVSPKGSATGAVVGAVYDCCGQPLASVLLRGRRPGADSRNQVDSLTQVVDSTFATKPLAPGRWELNFYLVGYSTRSIGVTVAPGAVDTVMVQMSESQAVIGDCICANGDFGSQCCKPLARRACDVP